MPPTSLNEIIPVLQVAIGPVILISGVGLLLLTMTNRLGRAIDRARLLKAELSKRSDAEREQILAQVTIIYRRARMIRLSITLAALSVLLASALIITLFVTALLHWNLGFFVSLHLHRLHGVAVRVAGRVHPRHQPVAARAQAGIERRQARPRLIALCRPVGLQFNLPGSRWSLI